MSFRILTFNFEIVLKTMMTLDFKICNFIPAFVRIASKLSIFYARQFMQFICAEKQNFFMSLFTLTFHFEKNWWHFFAKFAASEHSIFYVRQFEKNAVHVRGKVCQRLMKNVFFPRFFFRRRWIREAATEGQLISELLFGVFNFPKKQRKNLMNFCPRI